MATEHAANCQATDRDLGFPGGAFGTMVRMLLSIVYAMAGPVVGIVVHRVRGAPGPCAGRCRRTDASGLAWRPRPDLHLGQAVIVVARGSSLHALNKHVDRLGDKAVLAPNVPTGIPMRIDLNGSHRDRGRGQPEQQMSVQPVVRSVRAPGAPR